MTAGSFIASPNTLVFPLEPWTVFVLRPWLSFSHPIMNTLQAICREREVLRRQHKALSTEDCYTFWLRRYMTALRDMPKGLSSEKKLETFLTDLARQRNISASASAHDFSLVMAE